MPRRWQLLCRWDPKRWAKWNPMSPSISAGRETRGAWILLHFTYLASDFHGFLLDFHGWFWPRMPRMTSDFSCLLRWAPDFSGPAEFSNVDPVPSSYIVRLFSRVLLFLLQVTFSRSIQESAEKKNLLLWDPCAIPRSGRVGIQHDFHHLHG